MAGIDELRKKIQDIQIEVGELQKTLCSVYNRLNEVRAQVSQLKEEEVK